MLLLEENVLFFHEVFLLPALQLTLRLHQVLKALVLVRRLHWSLVEGEGVLRLVAGRLLRLLLLPLPFLGPLFGTELRVL